MRLSLRRSLTVAPALTPPTPKSLFALLLRASEPSSAVRAGAALVLAQLLEGSKAHLAHSLSLALRRPLHAAQSRAPPLAFTSLAQMQAHTLRDTHTYLLRALAEERDAHTRVHLLRVRPLLLAPSLPHALTGVRCSVCTRSCT